MSLYQATESSPGGALDGREPCRHEPPEEDTGTPPTQPSWHFETNILLPAQSSQQGLLVEWYWCRQSTPGCKPKSFFLASESPCLSPYTFHFLFLPCCAFSQQACWLTWTALTQSQRKTWTECTSVTTWKLPRWAEKCIIALDNIADGTISTISKTSFKLNPCCTSVSDRTS